MSINKYNSEGYYDPTAYGALSMIEKEERALRPVVYICSPYTRDAAENSKAARVYSRYAEDCGYKPIAPRLRFPMFLNDDGPGERALGEFFGNALMSKCSEFWVFGAVSAGMEAEIRRAGRKHTRLRYFTEKCEEVFEHA